MVDMRNIIVVLFLCITILVTPILLYTYTDRLTTFDSSSGIYTCSFIFFIIRLLVACIFLTFIINLFIYMHSAADQKFAEDLPSTVSNNIISLRKNYYYYFDSLFFVV